MGLKYFDSTLGETRYKRRYVWAFWAGLAGLGVGLMVGALLVR
ncbi:MAG: hypothetical protein QM661_11095 [Solimonas sp.]